MEPQPSDPLLGTIVVVLAIASLAVWFALFDRLKHGPILAYEPRRPVPWSGAFAIPAVFFAITPLLVYIAELIRHWVSDGPWHEPQALSLEEIISNTALGMTFNVVIVGVVLFAAVTVANSKLSDIGLPRSMRELGGDIRIGFIAWLSSLIPVFGVNAAIIAVFGESEGHPLIHMVMGDDSPKLFALAFLSAVVQAPITEEIAFRLLLQGWFEKWEDVLLGWRSLPMSSIQLGDDQGDTMPSELLPAAEPERPCTGAFGLLYGWLPIIASSLLFAIAHFGYGPEPIPLFLLALILGYVYQRTHRIVPCMVTHALFNGMTLFLLWRLVSAGAE